MPLTRKKLTMTARRPSSLKSRRFHSSFAVVGGLVFASAILTPALMPGAPASATAPASSPVKEIVDHPIRDDGVKGTYYNRSADSLTIKRIADRNGSEISSGFTLKPGERFTFCLGVWAEEVTIYSEKSSVSLIDPDIGTPKSKLNDGKARGHDVGGVNRYTGASGDTSVKREADGNIGITGEQRNTDEWSNFNVFFEDHNPKMKAVTGTFSNNTDKALALRAYKDGRPTSRIERLESGQQHAFILGGVDSSVKVFNPSVSMTNPVGVLTYQCPNRYSVATVTSTFVDTTAWKPVTLTDTNKLKTAGGHAHLDAKDSKTFVERIRESEDPNIRVNDTGEFKVQLFKIGHIKL